MIINEGKQLSSANRYGIIVGQGLAHALRLRPGDSATLLVTTRGGALNSLDFEILGVFETLSKEYDDRAVRISLGAAHELLDTRAVHSLVFALDNTSKTDQVAERVAASVN